MMIYLLTLLLNQAVAAEAPSAQELAQDRLIDKLSHLQLNLSPEDNTRTSITLRLADLHAERGRRLAMRELDQGCTVCKAGQKDREKAVSLYTQAMPKLQNEQKSRVMIQVGHLNEMLGQESKAQEIYQQLVKDADAKVAADAELSLAEIYFKKRNYSQALVHYEKVKSSQAPAAKGLATHRSAWCYFNLDQIDKGVEELRKILTSNDLLSRGSTAGAPTLDKQFQEEVSRDFATFIARRPFKASDMEDLYKYSPDKAQLVHLSYLASEYERLGQTPAAISAWRYVIQKQSNPQARMEGHVHLAQLQAQHKDRTAAINDFEISLSLWTQMGNCTDSNCEQLRIRLKQFVIDWNQLEKTNPSKELLSAYQKYLEVFPQAVDMRLWQAQVATQLKEHDLAFQENIRVAKELSAELQKNPKMEKSRKDWLEISLLAAIENAELSKNQEFLKQATQAYLDLSVDRKQEVAVKYQRAQMDYEAGQYGPAAEQMKSIALDKKAPADIRVKAADLSLDSLVLLKDDVRLEAWSKELTQALPQRASEFSAVARKSVLTQSSNLANSQDLNGAWAALVRFDINGAAQEEKISYLKNKLILAEKLKKYPEARDAADQLLRQPGVSEEDARFALSRKAWLAELQFDFATSLAATEKIKSPEVPAEQHALRLALLAELADKDSRPYYKNFLKVSKDEEKNLAVMLQLIRRADNPVAEFNIYKKSLQQKPEIYTEVLYELYAKTGQKDLLNQAIATAAFANTPYGKSAQRTLLLDQYNPMVEKFAKAELQTKTQGQLAKSLKSRVALITEAEKLAAKAVDTQEWASQILFLNLVAQENERFYNEVLSLPMPEGLSPEEEQQYLGLLSQQAAPHQTKAQDIRAKLNEIYGNKEAFTKFREFVAAQEGPLRKVLISEMVLVRGSLTPEMAPLLADVGERAEASKPSLAEVEKARQSVREAPFDGPRIQELIKLEKQMGRDSMVSYLQSRLTGDSVEEAAKKN